MKTLLAFLLSPLLLFGGEWDSSVKIGAYKYIDVDGFTKTQSWLGTGTAIFNAKIDGTNEDVTFVLTNGHVAPDDNCIYTLIVKDTLYKDVIYIASIPKDDRAKKGDLGLLMVKGLKLPVVKIARADPEPGIKVHQFSYAKGGPCYLFEGNFLGHKGPDNTNFADVDFGDFIVYPGCSGSGVFTPSGVLFGVCFATDVQKDAKGNAIMDAKGMFVPKAPCFMVPNKQIRDFLLVEAPYILGIKHEAGPAPRTVGVTLFRGL